MKFEKFFNKGKVDLKKLLEATFDEPLAKLLLDEYDLNVLGRSAWKIHDKSFGQIPLAVAEQVEELGNKLFKFYIGKLKQGELELDAQILKQLGILSRHYKGKEAEKLVTKISKGLLKLWKLKKGKWDQKLFEHWLIDCVLQAFYPRECSDQAAYEAYCNLADQNFFKRPSADKVDKACKGEVCKAIKRSIELCL